MLSTNFHRGLMLYHFSFLLSQAQSNVFEFSAVMSIGTSLINLWKLERFQETFNRKKYQKRGKVTSLTRIKLPLTKKKKEIVSEVMLSKSSKISLLEYNMSSWGRKTVTFLRVSSWQAKSGRKFFTSSFLWYKSELWEKTLPLQVFLSVCCAVCSSYPWQNYLWWLWASNSLSKAQISGYLALVGNNSP